MAYRFVHAADIHLDSPLRSLALRNPELAALVDNATRRAFISIIDLCLAEQVDALLLAGDLYDGDQTSMKSARFLAEQLRLLDQAGIQTFVIRGNHDALSKITKELVLPPSVTLFDGHAKAIILERPKGTFEVVVHGLSFAKPQSPTSLLGKYKPPVEGAVNIGLMHTSLDGASGHDLYAPCSLRDLQEAGFHYWALGHIHKRAVSIGKSVVVMPGIPQGRDINEAGPKSVSLVTVFDDKRIEVEERFTSIAQFERITVDVAGMTEWRTMIEHISKRLEAARTVSNAEHLIMRLTISGATPLAWNIRRDMDVLKADIDLRVASSAQSWIEKIELDCAPPSLNATQGADPLTKLRGLIDDEILNSESFSRFAAEMAEELRGQLPAESRGLFGKDEDSFKSALKELSIKGADDVLARLHSSADTDS